MIKIIVMRKSYGGTFYNYLGELRTLMTNFNVSEIYKGSAMHFYVV